MRRVRFADQYHFESSNEQQGCSTQDTLVRDNFEAVDVLVSKEEGGNKYPDFVVNAMNAHERAQDAMMLAKAIQAHIRQESTKLRSGQQRKRMTAEVLNGSVYPPSHVQRSELSDGSGKDDFWSMSRTWLVETFGPNLIK